MKYNRMHFKSTKFIFTGLKKSPAVSIQTTFNDYCDC